MNTQEEGFDGKHSLEKHPTESYALEKHNIIAVSTNVVDTAAELVSGKLVSFDPTEAMRVRRKIDLHILPLMCVLYWIQSMDKSTLAHAAILGIRGATHLTTNQYNWLGTIFYLSYLVFEFPQNLCLQHFPVGKWMSFNIFVWAITLCCHAACKDFTSLFIARLVLGMCEGSITAGFMIVTSMFYTRNEQTLRIGYWFLMNGTAQIISGFLSFGVLHTKTKGFEPWQWLMVITGFLTFLTALAFWFLFPDSPTNAWFLTPLEREIAIQRIKENQAGVENKHFKKEQFLEALVDPKTWLFALFAGLVNVPNSFGNQRQIVVTTFGFTNLQTTLLGCVDGVVEIVTIWSGVEIVSRIPNSRAYVAVLYTVPNLLGVFLTNFLPWKNKVGLLFALWVTELGTTKFVLSIAWLASVTAGHTKRVTVNAIMLSAYCIGNAAGPFMWQQQYKPRNHVPWIIIGVCYVGCITLNLTIRWILSAENKRRDREPPDHTYDHVYLERMNNGVIEKVKVDKAFLDLTDRQNRDFRYVL